MRISIETIDHYIACIDLITICDYLPIAVPCVCVIECVFI